jgi:monooxygenase
VRFGHKVVGAEWCSEQARWSVQAERGDGEQVSFTCGFLLSCSGYYRYDQGYTPEFAGSERFGGQIVHPQHWPEDLDYANKRVVVIGSGATAVTLVPAMAERAAHVTMLQRSPSYVFTLPAEDPIANVLRRALPPKLAYAIVRWKNVAMTMLSFQLSRRRPQLIKRIVRRQVSRQLPADYDVDTHFKPTYNPWDQRLCLVPDGDLFTAISAGSASVVTDHVDMFTESGVRLRSGVELEADVIVTATGLNLLALGGIELRVDGEPVAISDAVSYKGMMLSGVPNFAVTFGYTNASWTLKCDLTCEYVCRLLNHMDAHGYDYCAPPRFDPALKTQPFIDFSSGYVQRGIGLFPRQGEHTPWRLHENYALDIVTIKRGQLDDGTLQFLNAAPPQAVPAPPIAA